MPEWQPIETAPKDGCPILIATTTQIVLAAWHRHQGGPGASSKIPQKPNWCVWANGDTLVDEGWDDGAGWFMELDGKPTHWMPEPKPPKSKADEERVQKYTPPNPTACPTCGKRLKPMTAAERQRIFQMDEFR